MTFCALSSAKGMDINMKELENVMSKLEKATKKKEQMDNQIKLLKQREKKC